MFVIGKNAAELGELDSARGEVRCYLLALLLSAFIKCWVLEGVCT